MTTWNDEEMVKLQVKNRSWNIPEFGPKFWPWHCHLHCSICQDPFFSTKEHFTKMCFIERETQNVILKLREIFLWRETVLRTHVMKSDEKLFFCQIYVVVLGKTVLVVIDRYFSLFLKGLKIFSQPEAITDSPFNLTWWFKMIFEGTGSTCCHGHDMELWPAPVILSTWSADTRSKSLTLPYIVYGHRSQYFGSSVIMVMV